MQPRLEDEVLRIPTLADVPRIHELYSDPRVWEHAPRGRHVTLESTRALVEYFITCWERDGLGPWLVEDKASGRLLGTCGCTLRNNAHWNLGYRFTPAAQGRGLATKVARLALAAAAEANGALPRVASILEHNHASVRVATRVGLTLRFRGNDDDGQEPHAMRLLYADRRLDEEMVSLVLGR
ncbi:MULTISPECIES: GNAT family N-acetyltransferase [Arthrobacter]|uniref:GNAT family N-acetyltransferase n=2 Tax=Arthrobacter TaxID=1663 RepID=A0ABU9KR99_9MICC|nr:GNAT family N-acetyltransferase [Arthrobacter sp. YJM1]MDP5228315.1 GNAT family N-acetyltransferase [Arthrobacter sp. YJM1]